MKKLLLVLSLLTCTVSVKANYASYSNALKAAGFICGVYGAYKLYYVLKYKLEKHVEQKFINLIKLQFKGNINCTEQELQDKAWLLNMRKCLIERLEQVDSSDSRWSQNFADQLKKYKTGFGLLDKARNKVFTLIPLISNRYEQEYAKPYNKLSYFERMFIDRQVNNILLKFKPDSECTTQEMIQKQVLAQNSARIQKIILHDLSKMALKKTVQIAAGCLLAFLF